MPEYQSGANSSKNSSVLISGGSGLIGRYLTVSLIAAGYKVSHLSRNTDDQKSARIFKWDPEKRTIDPAAFEGIDFVINLAGANIGEKRWSKKRKEEIRKSRVDSTKFLHDVVIDKGIRLKAFISASAVGIYGSVTSDKIYSENDLPSTDFLATTCMLWEEAAELFERSGIRTVKIRTAVVLEKSDSALSKLMRPGQFGFLIQTGNGHQYMPWIHIDDLCNIYLKAIEDSEIRGPYNAVAPQHVTHKDFMHVLARVMKVPVIFSVPDFIIRAALGEMSDVILKGSRVSSEKIIIKGNWFRFNKLEDALNNVIR
jgi:uncharacterized protein (TIGR01777 family)